MRFTSFLHFFFFFICMIEIMLLVSTAAAPAACPTSCAYCKDASPGQCSLCNKGYALTSSKLCSPCSEHCTKCDQAGPDKCDSDACIQGHPYEASTQTCSKCSPHCEDCTRAGMGKCDTCQPGYELTESKECTACVANCKLCDKADPGKCNINGCARGYGFFAENQTCGACAKHCDTCDMAGPGRCDDCSYPYKITKDGVCIQCGAHCLECSDAGEGKCDENACEEGYGIFKENRTCGACREKCKKCDESGAGKCDPGNNDDCGSYRYYFGTFDSSRRICESCGSNCRGCSMSGPGLCDPGFCSNHTAYVNGTCKDCPDLCTQCKANANSTELECTVCGYYYGASNNYVLAKDSSVGVDRCFERVPWMSYTLIVLGVLTIIVLTVALIIKYRKHRSDVARKQQSMYENFAEMMNLPQ